MLHRQSASFLLDRNTLPSASTPIELTILMPCLNEAETLALCIDKAQAYLARSGIAGEVVIADNGSTDGSQDIACAHGARVVDIPVRGYGAALIGGIRDARGRYVIMGDSDDSYDFGKLELFVEMLREGFDLVMGNRFRGGITKGAMPPLHRFLGNPILTFIGRLFFNSPCGDFHCGLRGFSRRAMLELDLQGTGMEFASEMVVKATVMGLRVTEVPTVLHKDGRSRPPHLRSWRDGWRHLRFMLLYSPRWLFLYPGLVMLGIGLLGMAWLLPGPRRVGSVVIDVHTLVYMATSTVIGLQSCLFWMFAKVFGEQARIVPPDPWFRSVLRLFTVESGLIAGIALLVGGLLMAFAALGTWTVVGFGSLNVEQQMRVVIPSATLILLGLQIVYAAFFLTMLQTRRSA